MRQIYLHFQLRLPALYFSRVARVFEDAELSMPDIRRMAVSAANQWKEKSTSIVNSNWDFEPSIISPPFSNLKTSWEGFIDSLMREWKTLNIVSVLLLSAILTILQIEAAAADPITRYFALASLVCALMSLLYGCMFIIRFGTMRKAYKAAEWAEEAQKMRTSIWWNIWVLLSMPSVWLSWAIIFYVACIMSFVWRTGTTSDPIIALTSGMALAPRLVITGILSLGITYFLLIVNTFWKYEDDKARKQRLLHWAETASTTYRPPSSYRRGDSIGGSTRVSLNSINMPLPQSPIQPEISEQSISTSQPAVSLDPVLSMPIPASFSRPPPNPPTYMPPFKTVKVMDLRFHIIVSNEMPPVLLQRDMMLTDWHTFISDGALTWDNEEGRSAVGRARPQDAMAHFVEWWNVQFFRPRHVQAILCQELSTDFPASPMFAIYLVDLGPHTALVHGDVAEEEDAGVISRFGSVPTGLERIDVFDPPDPDSHGMIPMGKTIILTGPHVARVHWGGGATFLRGPVIPPMQQGQTSRLHSDAATASSQSSSGGSLASEQGQEMVHLRLDEGPGVTLEAS
ncbi:hypothetical protein BDZ94DRAFT_1275128 [Collybia nuda]|uniref:Uncharacterized protein n=1 Tax=Collybia nuda TaxID=64659 RepID=A0A9P5XTX9_9AGAR|nr:hypothetical protein BDZ94DRAFT_1275128 [Collybia nuda]